MKTMIGDGENKVPHTFTKHLILIVLAAASILLVPLLAMQFTNEVSWDGFDFAVAGGLLVGTGLMYELTARKLRSLRYRAVVGVALALALVLVWVELAVGIIGS
jgi:hypothetical protein